MEKAGVISKVTESTPNWCSGMVVVPKQSGKVRICVDLKDLNESMLRETHPVPGVDDILAQLSRQVCLARLMQTADSGKYRCQKTPAYSPPSLLLMGDTVLTSYLSGSVVHLNCSRVG